MLPAFSPEAWLALAEAEGVTNAFVVPTMLSRIIETMENGTTANLSNLRALAYGGGKMPLELMPFCALMCGLKQRRPIAKAQKLLGEIFARQRPKP